MNRVAGVKLIFMFLPAVILVNGPQKGDPPATISAKEQQKQTVKAIEAFLAQRIEG